jgi:hypothetical protein
MKVFKRSLILAAGLLAVVAAAQDLWTIKIDRKEGSTQKLKMEGKVAIDGLGEGTFTGTISSKIVKVKEDGGYVESSKTSLAINFGGMEMQQDQQGESTYSKIGECLSSTSQEDTDGISSTRMSRFQSMVMPEKPIKEGDEWEFISKGSKTNGGSDVKYNYKFEKTMDLNGKTVAVISCKAKEDREEGITGEMTYYVAKSGRLEKGTFKLKGVEVPGAPGKLNFDTTVTAID